MPNKLAEGARTGGSLDLQRPPYRWDRVRPPSEWRPVTEVCERIYGRLETFSARVVDQIWSEIPFYAATNLPRADVTESVYRNLEMLLFGLAEHRPPTADELTVRKELGRRRANQGLAIDALLQAYHVGFRELWNEMLIEAAQQPPETWQLLLTAAGTAWEWVHQVTNVIAQAYHDAMQQSAAQLAGRRQRLLEIIVSGDIAGEEAAEVAIALDFDPEAEFRACAIRIGTDEHPDPTRVQPRLESVGGQHLTAARGRSTIILSQRDHGSEVPDALARYHPTTAIGVGLRRSGLAGARQSVVDAEEALLLSSRSGRPRAFEEDWLLATLVRSEDRLHAILSQGADVARKHPHLAEAVRTFALSRFSVADAARTMALHNNTVSYRLRRWKTLTGWDPFSFEGLVRSIACLESAAQS